MDQFGQVIFVADLHHCRRAAFQRLFVLVHLPLLDLVGYSDACPVVCRNTHGMHCKLHLQRLSNRNRHLYNSLFFFFVEKVSNIRPCLLFDAFQCSGVVLLNGFLGCNMAVVSRTRYFQTLSFFHALTYADENDKDEHKYDHE